MPWHEEYHLEAGDGGGGCLLQLIHMLLQPAHISCFAIVYHPRTAECGAKCMDPELSFHKSFDPDTTHITCFGSRATLPAPPLWQQDETGLLDIALQSSMTSCPDEPHP